METIKSLAGEPLSEIKVGDTIKALTLFGWHTVTVAEMNESGETATAYNEGETVGIWMFKESGLWHTQSSFNPKAVLKVQVVD